MNPEQWKGGAVMPENDAIASTYRKVKEYAQKFEGSFTSGDILADVPGLNRNYIRKALIKLMEEGYLKKYGTGRGTYYYR